MFEASFSFLIFFCLSFFSVFQSLFSRFVISFEHMGPINLLYHSTVRQSHWGQCTPFQNCQRDWPIKYEWSAVNYRLHECGRCGLSRGPDVISLSSPTAKIAVRYPSHLSSFFSLITRLWARSHPRSASFGGGCESVYLFHFNRFGYYWQYFVLYLLICSFWLDVDTPHQHPSECKGLRRTQVVSHFTP